MSDSATENKIESYAFTLDGEGKLLRADSAFLRLCGYEIGQKPLFDFAFDIKADDRVISHSLITKSGERLNCISFVSGGNFRMITEPLCRKADSVAVASYDALTGLKLRSRELIDSWLAKKQEGGFAAIFADIDDFKSVNDTKGHAHGDRVLARLAKLLKRTFRSGDLICRYGGDEFLILLDGCGRENAAAKADMLVKMAADEGISLSVGVACTDTGEDIYAVIDGADRAMYKAKKGGKRRAVSDTSGSDKLWKDCKR